jgi:hypothetical protein
VKFFTQWPAKLDGEVTMETKSGGTDPSKGGFSFKLKPKGQKGQPPSMEPLDATAAAMGNEPAHLSNDDLNAVTQTPRLTGPGARAAKTTDKPQTDVGTLGRELRRR